MALVGAAAVVIAWLLATWTSVAPMVSIAGSYQRWAGLATQFAYVALFVIAARVLPGRMFRFAEMTVTAAAIVCVYGIIQRFGLDPLAWIQGPAPEGEPTSGVARPFSTLGNPAFLASYLTCTVFVTGALLLASRWLTGARLLYAAALILQLTILLLTLSRASWVGFSAGLVLCVGVYARIRGIAWRRPSIYALSVLAAVAVGLALAQPYLPSDTVVGRAASIFGLPHGSTAERVFLWRSTLELWLQRPLVGFGPDTLGSVLFDNYPPELWRLEQPDFALDRAHNALLDTLASVGLLGVLALSLVGALALRATRSLLTNLEVLTSDEKLLLGGAWAALVAHVVEQQFTVECTAASVLAFTLAGGLIGSSDQFASFSGGTVGCGRSSVALRVGAALLLALFVAWQSRQLIADADYARGLVDLRAGFTLGTATHLEQSVERWPIEPTYWNELARTYAGLARTKSGGPESRAFYRNAVAAAEHAMMLNPASPLVRSNFGLIAGEAASQTHDESLKATAIQAHRSALSMAPGYWVLWRSAGATAFDFGDYDMARDDFKRASSLFDGDFGVWAGLGQTYEMLDEPIDAMTAYKRALDLRPSEVALQQKLAKLTPASDSEGYGP